MLILSKLKFRFAQGGEVFTSAGGNAIETAPDWIQQDPLFPLAVKDGSLVCVEKSPVFAAEDNGGSPQDNEPIENNGDPVPKKPTAAKKK